MPRRLGWSLLALIVIGCEPSVTPPQKVAPPPTGSTTGAREPANNSPAPADQSGPNLAEPTTPVPDPGGEPAVDAVAANADPLLRPDQWQEGWIALFDGETLFGWKPNSELNWRVEDGVIVADEGQPGLLQTTSRFADFELTCEFRVEAGGNSGIFLRSAFTPSDPGADCYELNICDTHPQFKSGSLVKRGQPTKEIQADGEWHTFHVRVEGPHVAVRFDDEPILDYTDDTETPLTIGHIGLQMNGGKAEFKNVFLKPLGEQPLFDGTTLSGWRVVDGSQSEFEVQDGTIHVTNGRGFLETEATAKNFILQFDAKTSGDKLNSGVFFRAMPGTEAEPSNGYEFQIQNGFHDNDRTKPDDQGTGAIFRRAAARRVVSNDHEWFTATLVADGPHFATWVNGIPVVDWTDERPPHENPRKGLRLEAGHFSLQGHDPTTDLHFRNLRLVRPPE